MKIKVYGKAHLEGTSKKTGRDYNFNQVHYLGVSRGVEGQAALTMSLDPSQFPYADIKVGEDYKVEFDNRGNPVEFTPVPAAR